MLTSITLSVSGRHWQASFPSFLRSFVASTSYHFFYRTDDYRFSVLKPDSTIHPSIHPSIPFTGVRTQTPGMAHYPSRTTHSLPVPVPVPVPVPAVTSSSSSFIGSVAAAVGLTPTTVHVPQGRTCRRPIAGLGVILESSLFL